jgi:metal-dependent amidase/aminoacylase/carboxypeptidase family protein
VAAAQGLTVAAAPVSLAGEDFAYYQTTLPGCFVLVGTGKSPANHNPAFRVDPAALGPAAAYLAALAMQALIRI